MGSLLQVSVSDDDNQGVFLMQRAVVSLTGAVDGMQEAIAVSPESVVVLQALNITVDGKPFH